MESKSFTTTNPTFVTIMREKGIEPSDGNPEAAQWAYDRTPAFQFALQQVLSHRSYELASGEVCHDR